MRQTNSGSNGDHTRLAVALITFLGAGLRFGALDAKTVWLDEAFSLWMATQRLPEMLAWIAAIDHHPPLYYLLLFGWLQVFPATGEGARALSALLSTAAIPLFSVAAIRLLGKQAGLVAMLLLAVAPFQVQYAQEARMYALLTLTVAGVAASTALIMTCIQPGRWVWAGLVVSQTAAMLTHNITAVLLPLALNVSVAAAWWQARQSPVTGTWQGLARAGFWRGWVERQLLVALLWSPWAWDFLRQARVVDASFWIEAPTVATVWATLGRLTVGQLPLWWPLGWLWILAAVWLIGLGLRRLPKPAAIFLGGLWLLPPVAALLVGLRRPIFYDRTLIWIMLPVLMLLAAGIARLERRGLQIGALVLVLGLNGLGLWTYYVESAKEPWDEAAAVVVNHAVDGDLVLFHASWVQLPFDYYAGQSEVRMARHGVPADLFEDGELEPPMTEDDVPALRRLLHAHERVWLVYSHWWYTDPERLVLRTLEEDFRLAAEATWPGITVRQYVRAGVGVE